MKKTLLIMALSCYASLTQASTAYGTLNNFDAVNDTGVETHGFEIEIDDVRSTSVTYTYDYNHYGHPIITEDLSDPLHPKTFVRYESKKTANGAYASYTAVPKGSFPVTNGHQCTNPSVNDGCEHFGVGYYGAGAVKYNWLIDDPLHPGILIHGPAVQVGTPTWTYVPPVLAQPARVIAVIPAPPAPIPPAKQYGKPSWVKVIKTKTHNNKDVALEELISDDKDGDGKDDWTNGEEAEVESEWYLLQTNSKGDNKKDELAAKKPDELKNGDEKVTRRYEFYKYKGSANTIDGENGEAMCDQVAADDLHGVGVVDVTTDAEGHSHSVDCSTEELIGDYTGAQMAGFAVQAPLGLIEHIEDGKVNKAYTDRTVVVGGNTPYVTKVTGDFPLGLEIDSETGVLSGTPTESGVFAFKVEATDKDNNAVSKDYTITIEGIPPTITTAVLPDATELAAYSVQLIAGGGTQPYQWRVNALPSGLSLSPSGLLSGIPDKGTAGVRSATFTVTDKALKTANKALTLKILAAPAKLGDIDGDGDIDIYDLKLIKLKFGQAVPANSVYDLNGDLKINIVDLRKAVKRCTKAKCLP